MVQVFGTNEKVVFFETKKGREQFRGRLKSMGGRYSWVGTAVYVRLRQAEVGGLLDEISTSTLRQDFEEDAAYDYSYFE